MPESVFQNRSMDIRRKRGFQRFPRSENTPVWLSGLILRAYGKAPAPEAAAAEEALQLHVQQVGDKELSRFDLASGQEADSEPGLCS